MPKERRWEAEARETLGMPPQMGRAYDTSWDPTSAPQIGHGPGGRAARRGGINLPAVAEVLISYGLDPTTELSKVLVQTRPVLDKQGKPVLDPDTLQPVTEPVLDVQTRTRLLTELMQYVHPKLKSVEVTVKEPELTDEQIDKRLDQLVSRMSKGKA